MKLFFFFFLPLLPIVVANPERGCGVSILGDTQIPTGHCPEQAAVVDSALGTEWLGLDNLQQSLPASAILCFCFKLSCAKENREELGDFLEVYSVFLICFLGTG